jgi:hypothetical protein
MIAIKEYATSPEIQALDSGRTRSFPPSAQAAWEVYRARDTRLKREVAIKILPESFAADPDRLARFQRRAAAAHRSHSSTVGPSARADL